MSDYKDKIRKLLALAESPNENEAKAALLKARRLMAENKLTEADIGNPDEQEVKKIITDITFSKRRNPWVSRLCVIVAENYCCKAYMSRTSGKQTRFVGFIGLRDDIEVCEAIFRYAMGWVLSELARIKQSASGCHSDIVASLCNGYGYGFCEGLKEAFARQNKANEEEWGLVLVVPKAVDDAINKLDIESFRPKAMMQLSKDAHSQGYEDGKAFDPKRRLGTDAAAM